MPQPHVLAYPTFETDSLPLAIYSAAILASISFTHGGSLYFKNPEYMVRSLALRLRPSIICLRVPSLLLYCELLSFALCCSQLVPVHMIRFGTLRVIVSGSDEYLLANWRMVLESP